MYTDNRRCAQIIYTDNIQDDVHTNIYDDVHRMYITMYRDNVQDDVHRQCTRRCTQIMYTSLKKNNGHQNKVYILSQGTNIKYDSRTYWKIMYYIFFIDR